VPVTGSRLTLRDRLGTALVRLGINRMRHTVEPGLYAVNRPDGDAPVLVTANYKLSFDHLRRSLGQTTAWILVLDTGGINVWCAAGKGSFGTATLCAAIAEAGLDRCVRHRRLIVPQLGAPGVSAHEVKQRSGFAVLYGPVAASDLPEFLVRGCRATPAMRRKTFSLTERLVLVPVELTIAVKWAFPLAVLLYLSSGIGAGEGGFWQRAAAQGFWRVAGLAGGIVGGSLLTPLLLPVLPGRAFSLKGLVAGLAVAALFVGAQFFLAAAPLSGLEIGAWLLLICVLSSFLGMEFTGASTYTSLSGVKKEMRLALPLQIGGGLIAVILWLAARFAG
jgi:acetyl-CoA decarbonylase/synthase complex subunit gamma